MTPTYFSKYLILIEFCYLLRLVSPSFVSFCFACYDWFRRVLCRFVLLVTIGFAEFCVVLFCLIYVVVILANCEYI